MRRCLLFMLLLLTFANARAQYNAPQNMVWAFGDSAAVSFATGTPVAATSHIQAPEGCAAVSDAAGNLLFYTEGTNIYNATHAVMPHGTNVCAPYATNTITQGTSIVPMPGVSGKYYVFSLGIPFGGMAGENCHLVYSIVDMAMDGGLGDVDTAGIPLNITDSVGEKMVTVRGNGCNVWLMVHRRSMPHVLVYEITPAGIGGPVTYTFGGYSGQHAFYLGTMKASPDGQKLVSQSQRMTGSTGRTELYDFNPGTGVVSNRQLVDSGMMFDPYGAEFSADNSKLYSCLNMYLGSSVFTRIWQYNLSLPTLGDISASRTTISTFMDLYRRDLKLAGDNKIYVCNFGTSFLDCIPNPDFVGASCGYIPNAVGLGTGVCESGLPNTVQMPPELLTIATHNIDTCLPPPGIMTLGPTASGSHHVWQDGSTAATHDVTATGDYWVRTYDDCDVHVDTFRVVVDTPMVYIGNDTTILEGDVIVLTAVPGGGGYVWSNGKVGDTIHVGTAGTYWVTTWGEATCVASDTIVISVVTGVRAAGASVGLSVYPNPAEDMLMVSADGMQGNRATISIIDVRGVRVLEESVSVMNGGFARRMDMHNLSTGIYMIRVEDDAGYRVMQKLRVQ